MLNKRELILECLRGNMEYGVPWMPRMDIWYYANFYRNTLPEEFKTLSLKKIIHNIGIIYNKTLPDFADDYRIEAVKDRLLGIFDSRDIPYKIELDTSIKRTLEEKESFIEITYETSNGCIKGSFMMDNKLKESGSTLPPIKEHLIKSEEDYHKVMDIFSSMKIIPQPENYQRLLMEVGEQGYAPIYGHLAASPMQAILRDLMDPFFFFTEYKLNIKKLLELSTILEKFLLDILKAVLQCSCEPIVVWGGNYDSMLTFPPFFKEHILPFLNKISGIIHEKKGMIISHCDGENSQLLDMYRESGIDVLQAVNVKPMVINTYREIRDRLRPNQIITGGIPSVILLNSSYSDDQFKDFLEDFRKNYNKGEPLILEASDNIPPDANLSRLKIIGEFAKTL